MFIKPENSVLMIIDVQEKLANVMDEKEKVCKNINVLISMARTFDMEVLITEQYPKGLGFTCEELKIDRNQDFIEDKMQFSAFTDGVKEKLKKIGKTKIIVTGMETHICVYQTVRDLVINGYDVYLVRDAVCSRTEENKVNGLYLMNRAGAVITNTETVLYDVLQVSGTAEFKELSKLIK